MTDGERLHVHGEDAAVREARLEREVGLVRVRDRVRVRVRVRVGVRVRVRVRGQGEG